VHALAVCKVVAAGDFVSFFNLREGAPNLNGIIMGGFPLSLYAETLQKFQGHCFPSIMPFCFACICGK
jgi:hypothetical protein